MYDAQEIEEIKNSFASILGYIGIVGEEKLLEKYSKSSKELHTFYRDLKEVLAHGIEKVQRHEIKEDVFEQIIETIEETTITPEGKKVIVTFLGHVESEYYTHHPKKMN